MITHRPGTKAAEASKPLHWKARVLWDLAYFLCDHVTSHECKTVEFNSSQREFFSIIGEVYVRTIIETLNSFGLLDWGNKNNILPITTGLAFMNIVPEDLSLTATADYLLSNNNLSLKLPFTPQLNYNLQQFNLSDILQLTKQHCLTSPRGILSITKWTLCL